MFKFKGFWNPLTEEGRVGILRNSIKSTNQGQVRLQVIKVKRGEMNKLVRKAIKQGKKITANEIIKETIDKYPKFKEFYEKELGLGYHFFKDQAEAAIRHKGRDKRKY